MTENATRERVPTNYDVVYEVPPPAPNATSGGQLQAVLEKLVEDNTGEWARIADCKSRSGANSILTGIKQNKRRLPEGVEVDHFEFTARTNSEDNTSKLYARYVGEAGVERAAARRARRKPAAS